MQTRRLKTLGLVITDGVGFRNFVLSDFLKAASSEFDKLIIYSGLPKEVYDAKEMPQVEIKELPVFAEPSTTWFWRKTKEVAHLQLHKDFFGIKDNLLLNKSTGSSKRARATRFIYSVTSKLHSEKFIEFVERRQIHSLSAHTITRECIAYLKQDKPDLLFFTHQRPPYVVSLVAAAEKLKIRTSSFIFSWDNLSSKGRMAARFDFFLVWSSLMEQELLYFYPSTSPRKVEIVGTPQFEPYVMPKYYMKKEDFLATLKVSEGKKILCYSCGDISTSRNDELYIEVIAAAIEQNELSEKVELIVRTSPAEDSDRFFFLGQKFPFIRWNYPDWYLARLDHPEPWSQRIPSEKDLKDLRALLMYADISINMCSTMSLDFMLFDKPVINPVFGNETNELYNDQRFLKFGHYEKVVKSSAVKLARNRKELIDAINFYLQNPTEDKEERRNLLDLQIGKPLEGTSSRIVRALKEFSEFD
ncbi:CDP-glycerol glycerophosphotransferase family protein [Salinimicrobium sediminilitoris]|uniref:CDP-glycerol glycerophosphotransferase family protein n=1 Tax=Salinimicrobium sediminilitoris TaxID=2876715 RepID=UPI001E39EF5B|nr:CDP-glycerol glycerophosphotransferase family protein [Salinimicrobium sediminilitoris]MCC8358535.1 CDP-glycerol glycerophosphotransferase family protein [Salinimicrobium sediminilitoris]